MFFTGVFWSVLLLNTLGEESVADFGTDVNINGDDKMDQRNERNFKYLNLVGQ